MFVLLNVINRAEGFAWDGAICFLSYFSWVSRGLFPDSSSEAAVDSLIKMKHRCFKDNRNLMCSFNLCSPRGDEQLPEWV